MAKDIEITLYDPIVPSGTTSNGVGKNISRIYHSRDGYALILQKRYRYLYMLGPVGDKIENWKLKGRRAY